MKTSLLRLSIYLNLFICSTGAIAINNGPVVSGDEEIIVGGANFAPLGMSESVNSLDGCYHNRMNAQQVSGDMYAGVDIPAGVVINGITGYVIDIGVTPEQYAELSLRRRNGIGNVLILAEISSETFGYFEEHVEIEPGYVVQNDDFFDLVFTSNSGEIANAFYICGAKIFYSKSN